jgi:hypothetical protein
MADMINWSAIQSTATNVGVVIMLVLIGIIILAIVGFSVYFYQLNKAYKKYKVVIFRRYKDNNGNEIPAYVGEDKGRWMYDKKLKKVKFHLKIRNIDMGESEKQEYDSDRDLDIPKIPNESGGYVVFIEQVGIKRYAFAAPFVINGNVQIKVTEADVAEAIRTFDLHTRTFGKKQNELLVLGFYFGIAALTLVLIIIVINKFDMIVTAAETLKSASQNMAASGGNVIPSNAPG